MDRRFGFLRLLGSIGFLAVSGAAHAQTTIALSPLTTFQIIGVQCGQPPVTTVATGFAGAYATTWSTSTTTCGGSGRGGGYHTTTYTGCATARYMLTGALKDVTRVGCATAPDPGSVFQNDTGYSESTSGNLAVLGLPAVTPTYSWIGVAPFSVPLGLSHQFDASIVNDSSVPLHVYSVSAAGIGVSAAPVDPNQCAEVDLAPGASCAFTVGVFAGNGEVSQGTVTLSAVTSALTSSVFQQSVAVTDPLPACSDGIDNDGDGYVDFDGGASMNGGVPIGLPDPGCANAAGTTESPECQDGFDDDGDGFIDFDGGASMNGGVPIGLPDPGCANATSISESPPCQDGIDDDGDGLVDFDGGASANGGVAIAPPDPGCRNALSATESPQCQDGIDNDGDGFVDFDGGASAHGGVAVAPSDPQCATPLQDTEARLGCGLGAELAFALPLLRWLGSAKRRRDRR